MPELGEILSDIVDRSVIDKTGIKQRLDIDLKFDPCTTSRGLGEIAPGPNSATCADFSSYPSVSTGLREQLGLLLDSTKGAVEVLFIDHVEKPTAN
jgi:uncharacterized protein (TIGR03435 family)